MQSWGFYDYCDKVCRYVRCRADHPAIRAELAAHMEDRAEALAAQGLTLQEAAAGAIAAMGDPEELGRALDRLHSPWLARVQRAVHRLCMAALVLTALAALIGGRELWGTVATRTYSPEYVDDRIVLWESSQRAEVTAGGYRVELGDIRLASWPGQDEQHLYLTATVTNLDPRLADPEFLDGVSAVDDLGNEYLSSEAYLLLRSFPSPDRSTSFTSVELGAHRSVLEGAVFHVPEEAARITLVFEEEGWSFRVPIQLPGGDGT